MLFNSLQYLAFLAVTVAVYWSLPAGVWRRRLLLVASIGFYAAFDLRLPLLLFVISITSWLVGRALPRLEGRAKQVTAGVGIGTSIVAVFGLRAYGWLTHGTSLAAAPTAFGGSITKAIVPVGLAFVTFHSISYIVDVYRGQMDPSPSFADHVLYICFFPHLLAGPVMRARRLVPAFHSVPAKPNPIVMSEGAELLVVGMFKKVVLADPAIGLVTRLAVDPKTTPSLTMWGLWLLGLTAAYFDITGYIDMARGSAKLLGIELQPNSMQPLLRSSNLTEFWRRWQVTVMMWFRDYVFLPIRGRRRNDRREMIGLVATFVALALWHGTSVGWLIWGALTGTIVTLERVVQGRKAAANREKRRAARRRKAKRAEATGALVGADAGVSVAAATPRRVSAKGAQSSRSAVSLARGGRPGKTAHVDGSGNLVRVKGLLYVYLMLVLTLPWIGSPTIADTLQTYKSLFGFRGGPLSGDLLGSLLIGIVSLVLLDGRERARQARSGQADPPTVLRAIGLGVMVLGVVVYGATASQSFIYLRF